METKLRTMRHGYQHRGLVDLIDHINLESPTSEMRLLEIGCYAGESSSIFCGRFAEVTCVDPFVNGYDPKDSASRSSPMLEVQSEFRKRMRKHMNYRLIKKTSDDAIQELRGRTFDVVYIDGAHTYEQVTRDILNYSDLIPVGGYICGHDYCDGWPGVVRAVDECCGKPDKVFKDNSWMCRKRS